MGVWYALINRNHNPGKVIEGSMIPRKSVLSCLLCTRTLFYILWNIILPCLVVHGNVTYIFLNI